MHLTGASRRPKTSATLPRQVISTFDGSRAEVSMQEGDGPVATVTGHDAEAQAIREVLRLLRRLRIAEIAFIVLLSAGGA